MRVHDNQISGVLAACLTPMNDDLTINHTLLTVHCKWLLANGCDGIVLMGTTGEANSLSVAERMIALDTLLEAGIDPALLIVGTGCCALPDTLSLTRHAIANGVAGVLMLPPFYYKRIPDSGILASFDAVIQRVPTSTLQIYLYHFPQMSQMPFSDDVISALIDRYQGIIAGVKDSSGDWVHIHHLIKSFPQLRIFAGSEQFLLDALRSGGVGCISASANITCTLAASVYNKCQSGEAQILQERLTKARLTIQSKTMIPALKGVLARHTGKLDWSYLRPPLLPFPKEEIDELYETLAGLDLHLP